MTRGNDVAQSLGPTKPKSGRSAPPPWPAGQVLAPFQILLCQRVKEGQCTGYPMPKVGADTKLGCLAGLTSGPPEPHFRPKHRLNSPINIPLLLPVESVKKVRFSPPRGFQIQSLYSRGRGEVLRSEGLPGLSGILGVARARKLYRNPFRFDKVFRALVRSSAGVLPEFCEF
jgi:hypothetical protein